MDNQKVMVHPIMMHLAGEGASDNRRGTTVYLPPQIEVVTVAVERGFAASNGGGMQLPDWDII